MCTENTIPKIWVKTFPNQKPWMNADVRAKLKDLISAYNSGDTEAYRRARYDLQRAISSAKRAYKDKMIENIQGSKSQTLVELLTLSHGPTS